MRTVRFELLRPDEILEEKKRFPVIYFPVGPLEWHGPHLPLGTDPLNAETAARLVAQEIGGVVLPTFFWGTERERRPDMLKSIGFKGDEWIVGMDFPNNSMKSLYVAEEPFGVAVREYLRLPVKQKYKLIVIVNGHGGENHMEVLMRLAKEFSAETESRILYTKATYNDDKGSADSGHANKLETGIMRYLYPESVDLNRLPPREVKLYNLDYAIVDDNTFRGNPTSDFSVSSDPRDSTSELGREAIERSVRFISKMVKEEMKKLQI